MDSVQETAKYSGKLLDNYNRQYGVAMLDIIIMHIEVTPLHEHEMAPSVIYQKSLFVSDELCLLNSIGNSLLTKETAVAC